MKLRAAAVLGLCCVIAGCASTGGRGAPGGTPGSPAPSAPLPSTSSTPMPSSPSAPAAPSAPAPTASQPSASPPSGSARAEGQTSAGGTRRDGSADTGVAQTPAEKRAQVDGRLDASLGSFDAQLRREQQRTAEERDRRTADRGDGSAGAEQTADNRGSGTGGGSDSNGAGRDHSGDLRSEGVPGETGTAKTDPAASGTGPVMAQGGGGANAKPLPSGEDDDIIARRLRKAAEAETDPELKEKLWKEYRDYKENTHGGRG